MSIRLLPLVWDISPEILNSGQKAVLLRLADFCSDDIKGTGIFPTVNRIARDISYSIRNVQKIINSLIKLNLLSKEMRFINNRNTSNWYSINIPILFEMAKQKPPEILNFDHPKSDLGVNSRRGGGCHGDGGRVSPVHTEPLIEPLLIDNNKKINKKETSPSGEGVFVDDVLEIFLHWQKVMNHPKAQLDNQRKLKIKNALKSYSKDDLKKAINGCKLSPFHMGDNESGVIHDDICLILRNNANVERFIGYAMQPPRGIKKNASERREFGHNVFMQDADQYINNCMNNLSIKQIEADALPF